MSRAKDETLSWLGVFGLSVAVLAAWAMLIGEMETGVILWWPAYLGIPAAFGAGLLLGELRPDRFVSWLICGGLLFVGFFSWVVTVQSVGNVAGFKGFTYYFSIPTAFFLGFWVWFLKRAPRN